MDNDALTPGEVELVEEAHHDDIDMAWTLIHLGIRKNDGSDTVRPSVDEIDRAFESLQRLTERGLIVVGHTEYIDGGPPGRLAPVKLVPDPLPEVKQRVIDGLSATSDMEWRFSSWLTAT